MKIYQFGLTMLLTVATAHFACAQTKLTTASSRTATASAKQISADDQKAIKQLVGDKYDVNFVNGSAMISEKATKLSQVKVSNGKATSPGSLVAIVTVDVVINKNAKAGIDNLSQRLDKQSMQRLQAIMTKYQ